MCREYDNKHTIPTIKFKKKNVKNTIEAPPLLSYLLSSQSKHHSKDIALSFLCIFFVFILTI